MEKPTDNFLALEIFFKEHFGGQNLQFYACHPLYNSEQKYLRISNNLTSAELNYLPSFYIIGNILTEYTFSLKLISHHCKLLEEYHLDIKDPVLTIPPKLKQFCQNSLSLCPGINSGQVFDTENMLIEHLNEEVVFRSRDCQFATELRNTACPECSSLKLLSDLDQIHDTGSTNLFNTQIKMEDASDIDDDADADQAYLTEIFLPPKIDYVDSDCPSNVSGVYKKRKNRMDVVVHQAKDKDAVLKKLKDVKGPLVIAINSATYQAKRQHQVMDGNSKDQTPIPKKNLAKRRRRECSKCNLKFKSFSSLKLHYQESAECLTKNKKTKIDKDCDSNNFSQQCPICLHTYNQKLQYDLDQKSHEENLPELDCPVTCPVCDVTLPQRRLLNGHFHSAHNNGQDQSICCVCFNQMPRKRLKYHFRERHKPKNDGLLCPVCGKTIKWTQHDLQIHLACAHGVDKDCSTPTVSHVCPQCNKSYGHADRLKQHIFRAHESATSFPCDECEKVFCALSKLVEHKVCKHLKIRPFKCRLCEYVASQMNNVYKHCQFKHGFRGKRGDVEVDQELMLKIRKDLNYDYCNQSVQKVYSK